jgi:drug/metabolite transporter (DMT)-like permease
MLTMKKVIMFCLLISGVAAFSTVGNCALTQRRQVQILKSSRTDDRPEIKNTSTFDDAELIEASSLQKSETSLLEDADWFEPLAWRGVILILCALWASNFAVAKLVMAEPGVDSSLYALARFSVAALALAPGAYGAVKKADMEWETVKGGIICGCWVAFGYLGQTVGLLTTTASKSCVICSMHCVFVAAIAEYWRVSRSAVETKYDTMRLLPAAFAVLGVGIIELKGAGGAPTIGDALSFAQPIGFGMGYLTLEELMKKNPEAAYPVTTLKLTVVATASLMMFEFSPLVNNGFADFALRVPDFSPILDSPMALGGILYTGLITTAACLWVESIAFAKVPATDASIILTTEPLIAAGVGAFALGETFGSSDYVGASLIIGACALAVLLESPENEQPVSEIQEKLPV